MGDTDAERAVRWAERASCLALLVVVAASILFIARTVLPDTAITTDEHSYQMQARQFASGVLRYPYPGDHLRDFVWHRLSMVICDRDHGWFSRYPPGHALWLVPGVAVGAPYLMPLFAALVGLGLLAGTARRLGVARPLMLYLFTFSPFFLFMHATLLSHTTAFAAACALLYGYVRGHQARFAPGWMVFAGASWSYLYLTRPFTAFLIGLFFGLHAVATLARSWRDRAAWRGVLLFAGSAGAGIGATLLYNAVMLGDPFTAPYFYFKPEEVLGFGPDAMNHTVEKARVQFFENLLLWDQWLWGVPLTLPLFLVFAIAGWRAAWTPLFLAIFAAFWVGYFFFHYPGPHEIGPGYYFETLPFAMLAAAMGLQRWLDGGRRTPLRFAAAVLFLVALPGFMVPFSRARAADLRAEFHERTELYRLIRGAPDNALILFDHIGIDAMHYDNDSMLMYYPRGLDSDPLVLPNYHRGAAVLAEMFPGRTVYRLRAQTMEELGLERWNPPQDIDPEMALDRFSLGVGSNAIDADGTRVRTVRPGRAGLMAYGVYRLLAPGRYTFEAELDVAEAATPADRPVISIDLVADLGRTELWRADVAGAGRRTVRGEVDIEGFRQVEPRFHYHGEGRVALRAVRLERTGSR